MPGRFSDYVVQQFLTENFSNCWVGLHYDDPETAGAYASEVWGGAYIRQRASFTSPVSRVTWNVAVLEFAAMPAVIVTHVAAWDAQVNGNYLCRAELAVPVRVLTGASHRIGEHSFAISMS